MPTFDHRDTLRYSIPSVLAQTVTSLELVVIGDGAPPKTAFIVDEISSRDRRVRYVSHPKSPRTGEPHRDRLIRESTADVVAYCSDDDLWLPWHLEELVALLKEADFAHCLGGQVLADGRLRWWTIDLSQAEERRYLLEVENTIGLHAVAHTRSSYLRLPEGWDTAPMGTPTDYHMWRKYLSMDWVRAVSGLRASVVHLPSSLRKDWSLERKVAELAAWAALVSDRVWCEEVWPQLVATAQFDSWRETQSNLRSAREYLTRVLAARDDARAELGSERELGAARLKAAQDRVEALEVEVARTTALLASMESEVGRTTALLAALEIQVLEARTAAALAKANLAWVEGSLTWRTRARLLKMPLAGSFLRWWRGGSRSSS